MIKAQVEFDNDIASPLSPKKFIEKYVFNHNVVFTKEENNCLFYDVNSGNIRVMEIRILNPKQE